MVTRTIYPTRRVLSLWLAPKIQTAQVHSSLSWCTTHRISTVKNADVILVMRDGDIVETGRHEELMAAGGFYSELYRSQFEA